MSDVFHKTYNPVSEEDGKLIAAIKDKAEELYALYETAPIGRENSLSRTKLEESVMWAVKGITAKETA